MRKAVHIGYLSANIVNRKDLILVFRKSLLKKITLGLICAIVSISVIGCGKDNAETNTEQSYRIAEESQDISNDIDDTNSEDNKEDNQLSVKDEEFWVQFIRENSRAFNHATTDEIRVAPTDWIDNAPPLEILEGDEHWKIVDNDDVLNSVIEPGRKAKDRIKYMFDTYYSIEINVRNVGETAMTGKECIENGWYYINHFYSNYSEYSQLNKNAEDATDFLLYLDNRLGAPNKIYVCDTDDAYDHIECCNYLDFDDHSEATMYYYYIYNYTDRTLVVQVREYYTLDKKLNITDVDYEEADSIGLEQYYCPSNFDLNKNRILSIAKYFR